MPITEVYYLYHVGTKRSPGFLFSDRTSNLGRFNIDADFAGTYAEESVVPALTKLWTPRRVEGHVESECNLTFVSEAPAFSDTAISVLNPILNANGELLPLIVPSGVKPFWVYNTTTLADVLDLGKSFIDTHWSPNYRHEFVPESLNGLTIFRIRQIPAGVYVTQEFIRKLDEYKLTGFSPLKVWPLAPGTQWHPANPGYDGPYGDSEVSF